MTTQPTCDAFDEITRLNCGGLEQKLALDAALIASIRKRERTDVDAERAARLLGAASLLLEEAARCCLNPGENLR
jgi:hypothetical protein